MILWLKTWGDVKIIPLPLVKLLTLLSWVTVAISSFSNNTVSPVGTHPGTDASLRQFDILLKISTVNWKVCCWRHLSSSGSAPPWTPMYTTACILSKCSSDCCQVLVTLSCCLWQSCRKLFSGALDGSTENFGSVSNTLRSSNFLLPAVTWS